MKGKKKYKAQQGVYLIKKQGFSVLQKLNRTSTNIILRAFPVLCFYDYRVMWTK